MYNSTRSDIKVTDSKAILKGIASDGGLYVITKIPVISHNELAELSLLTYKEMAVKILGILLTEFSKDEIIEIVNKAYDNKFDIKDIVKVNKCDNEYYLELFHGPTLAFKDLALSVLPHLLAKSKEKENDKAHTIIITATSGDTGSAALSGFANESSTKMIVIYPTDGVSAIQEKQMLSFSSSKQKVIAIKGNFDDAQRLVKRAFNDKELSSFNLSSANSINIGRLLPQIIYYFYSYFSLVNNKEIRMFEEINYSVPTGNFGNILACYIAKKMGLPVKTIICASNSNNVLTDFFKYKTYNRNRDLKKTISPSMDILISSNLERLLYYEFGKNVVSKCMNELNNDGLYHIDTDIKGFYANYATEEETIETISKVYTKYDYLIDTHTSVAKTVKDKYFIDTNDKTKTIIVSTAHPYKFPKAVSKAIGLPCQDNEFEQIKELSLKTKRSIPNMILCINKEYPKIIWEKEKAYENLIKLIKELS